MRRFMRPGFVLGLVAVVLAMASGAVAASKVTGAQIKNSSLTGKDIRNGSLSSRELSRHARAALRGAQGPAGPAGPAGAAGPQGPAGPSAVAGLTPVTSTGVPFAGDYAQSATANCPAGQRVVSGGGASISLEGIAASQATPSRTGWFVVGGTSEPALDGQYVQAYALCAPANVAVASRAGKKASDRTYIARLVARAAAQQRR